MNQALYESNIQNLKLLSKGKVREVYEFDSDSILFVASDRISAFDVIMNQAIPEKGEILTKIANFWFENTSHIIENHLLSKTPEDHKELEIYKDQLRLRSLLVKKCKPLPIEFIVRGYLTGSGWKEYQKSQTVCGINLPIGLKNYSKIPEPILTPSTKAEEGHDENISPSQMADIIGEEKAEYLSKKAIELYTFGRNTLAEKGIILADTKFEFGELPDGKLILIDEVMTPDSSRFWDINSYKNSEKPHNFDKQTLRDWLETQEWNKQAPAPNLPNEIIEKINNQYKIIENKIL
jgi:phosphoribosylaminoimidazole-succinocarboxamide synthase